MTPTQARAFLAVAIEGSFTGAAKRLNLSQPSVTTQVGLLERQYKVELFHRIGRGVRLTPAGNALLPTVRRLFRAQRRIILMRRIAPMLRYRKARLETGLLELPSANGFSLLRVWPKELK